MLPDELQRRPSGLLVPRPMSPADARERILSGARVAGAGGTWQLFVPPQSYKMENPTSAGWENFPAFSLTTGNTPTLMSEWAVNQVYVPFGFYIVLAAAKQKAIVEARLSLFRNGDLVLSQELTQEAHELPEVPYGACVLNGVFSINPNNPVVLRARQTLSLQLSMFVSPEATYVSRRAYLSQQVGKVFAVSNNAPETLVAQAGTVTYDEANLPGHRTL